MKRYILFAALLSLLTPNVFGEDVKVRATINTNELYVGDSAELQVIIEGGAKNIGTPDIPDVEGMTIVSTGKSDFRSIGIGRVARVQRIYSYRVSGLREGEFQIPSISIRVDGKEYPTKPVKITVLGIPKNDELLLEASISSESTYVLAPVTVTYDCYITPRLHEKLQGFTITFPIESHAGPADFHQLRNIRQDNTVTFGRRGYSYGVRSETKDDINYVVFSFEFSFFPGRPGDYRIDSPVVRGAIIKDYVIDRRGFGFSTRRPVYEKIRATTGPLNLTVMSLPEEGQPEGFAGAVGQYSVSASADHTRVNVGDPIQLDITISGNGLLSKVPQPDLSALNGFTERFKIDESSRPGKEQRGAIVFNRLIRPLSPDTTEIPAIRFPYFNPDTEKYEVAESKPIPLTVLHTRIVGPGDVIKTPALDGTIGQKTRLKSKAGGINAIYIGTAALADQRVNLNYLWLLLLPAAGYFATAVVISKKRRLAEDSALARAKFARRVLSERFSKARRLVDSGGRDFYDSLWKGLGGFVADKLDLGTGELTAYDLELLGRESFLDEADLREMSDLLATCDEGRFGSNDRPSAEKKDLLRRGEELIRRIERSIRL